MTLDPTSHPCDTLFGGTMILYQPARGQGYRVNVDAVLLASFAGEKRRARRAVDLGAGVGAVGLSLLYRDRADHVVLVERDRRLSALASANLEVSGWQTRGRVVCADVDDLGAVPPAAADLVVCNPPFVAPGRGRLPAVGQSARVGTLAGFARAARRWLGPRGRASFVYPAPEIAALFDALREVGLEPKRMRLVHAMRDRPARVVLVEAAPAKRGGLVVEPPLVERDREGPSEEVSAILSARDDASRR